MGSVRSFLRGAPGPCGESEIHDYLRDGDAYLGWLRERVLPLGERAGVPECAAGVNLSSALSARRPDLSAQVDNPGLLLLPASSRPPRLKRPFVRLADSYPSWVQNARSGLQALKPHTKVMRHRGTPIVSGAFAVPKDGVEGRAISALCPLNELVDPSRLWKPKFAAVPALRVVQCSGKRRVRICKKDTRHFFHGLRIGRRWRKYMAHPPLPRTASQAPAYPLHCAALMGFAASASWAQGFNEVVAQDAALPLARRAVADRPCPGRFPVWASILDDFWFLEEETVDDSAPWGQMLLGRVGVCWDTLGLATNVKKDVLGTLLARCRAPSSMAQSSGAACRERSMCFFCKQVCTSCHAGMSGFV